MSTLTTRQAEALANDPDGLSTYEYIANNIESLGAEDIDSLADNMMKVDRSGQFTASAARYLHAIDAERYADTVRRLIAATIDRDREHKFLAELLPSIWGADYKEHVEELKTSDNNFRRIYKRLFPSSTI